MNYLNQIIVGDCLEVMRAMPDNSIDAVITDPPYCSGGVSESARTSAKKHGVRGDKPYFKWFVGDNMGTAGLTYLLRSVAFESLRLLKDSGSMLVFCDWRMVPNIAPAIESAGFRYQNMIVWDKGNMGLGTGFRAQHEIILHMTAGKPKYFDKATANVIQSKRVTANKRQHQTQKPQDLMEKLINVVCPDEGTVLDPFGGSGTTAIAAKETNRNFICIERDQDYAEIARQRVA